MKWNRRTQVVLWLLILLGSCGPTPQQEPEKPGIGVDELKVHLEFLAADEQTGRFPGTPGIETVEEYIASRFRQAGLENPPGFSDFFDTFDLFGRPWNLESRLVVDSTEFAIGADFAPLPLSGEGSVTAPVLFVGYGIEADEFDHHDYRNRDAAGKIVLALRHEPEEADPASSWAGEEFTRHATFLTKARLAKDRGALAFLTVTDPLHHEPDSLFPINHSLELTERRTSVPEDLEDFPALIVSDEVARRLLSPVLEEQEISFVELQRASESGPVVVNPVDPPVATIRLTRRRGTSIAARNVGALYRHPDGGEEGVVIVGAHHDHLGGGGCGF